jgi:protein required for attachment to host cells
MATNTTWVLIADAAHARVLETVGVGHKLKPVGTMTFAAELPPAHELGTDRPARVHDSTGHARHAVAAHTDPRRQLKRAFAHQLCEEIEAKLADHAFDRLVIVAPPAMLGDLRKHMSKTLSDHVAAEVAKDLVKTPNDKIRASLPGVTAI